MSDHPELNELEIELGELGFVRKYSQVDFQYARAAKRDSTGTLARFKEEGVGGYHPHTYIGKVDQQRDLDLIIISHASQGFQMVINVLPKNEDYGIASGLGFRSKETIIEMVSDFLAAVHNGVPFEDFYLEFKAKYID